MKSQSSEKESKSSGGVYSQVYCSVQTMNTNHRAPHGRFSNPQRDFL